MRRSTPLVSVLRTFPDFSSIGDRHIRGRMMMPLSRFVVTWTLLTVVFGAFSLIVAEDQSERPERFSPAARKDVERLTELAKAAEAEVAKLRESSLAVARSRTLPADPNRPGVIDWGKRGIDFRMEELSVYQKRSKDPAETQQLVEGFLSAFYSAQQRRAFNDFSLDEVLEEGQKCITKGVKDPIVLAYHQLILSMSEEDFNEKRHGARVSGLLKQVPIGDRGLPYEIVLRRELLQFEQAKEDSPKLVTVQQALASSVVRCLERHPSSEVRNTVWVYVNGILSSVDSETKNLIHQEILEAPQVADWYKLNSAVPLLIAEGWDARGTGVSSTVTQEGWTVLKDRLEQARQLALLAWTMQPDSPVPPTNLVHLTGAGAKDEWQMRDWFQIAVHADFGHMDVYSSFATFSGREWGGSDDQLLRFASECLESGRLDTGVPAQGLRIIEAADQRLRLTRSVASLPEMRAALKSFAEKALPMIQRGESMVLFAEDWSAPMLIWLVDAGHYSLAGDWLKGNPLRPEWLTAFGQQLNSLERKIAAGTGPGKEIADPLIQSLFDRERGVAGSETYQTLRAQIEELKKLDSSEQTRSLCQEMELLISQYETFEQGDWVELKFTENHMGWLIEGNGNWETVDDRTITVKGEGPTFIAPLAQFQTPYQVEVDIQTSAPVPINGMAYLTSGIERSTLPFSKVHPTTLLISPNRLEAVVTSSDDKTSPVKMLPAGETHRLRLKVGLEETECLVDEIEVAQVNVPGNMLRRIAIGQVRGPQCRFQNFRIQKLEQAPATEQQE